MRKLRELRLKNDMRQDELARCLDVSQSTISDWERGVTKIDSDAMVKIADFFDVSVDYLLDIEPESAKEMKKFIILPIKNIEEISPEGILSPYTIKRNEYICFSVIGDSMEPDMKDGDIAIVRLADEYETGSIVAIGVEEEYRALQHLTEVDTGIILKSLNPKYNLIPYSHRQLNSRNVYIAGRLVEVRRRYR
ncbi:MAG: helix-turn-helix domain-containing protein [Oscillospiraceae bacterium]|nr:helix-turn-helix domain-containing protein [Oscillospiraceae bacterium]